VHLGRRLPNLLSEELARAPISFVNGIFEGSERCADVIQNAASQFIEHQLTERHKREDRVAGLRADTVSGGDRGFLGFAKKNPSGAQ
jgi:hypothetical protein